MFQFDFRPLKPIFKNFKKRFKIFALIIVSALTFILVVSAFSYYAVYQLTTPLKQSFASESPGQDFVVEKGDSVFQIADKLEKKGFIDSEFWFVAYMLTKGWGAKSQAGAYYLSPSLTIPEISQKLVNGWIKSKEDISITLPEGFNVRQIDYRLAAYGLIKRGELIYFDVNELNTSTYDFLPKNTNSLVSDLEGYLFPDTYRFRPGSSVKEIIEKMLTNFQWKIYDEFEEEIKANDKSLYEILTFASLIEKEVQTDPERSYVASVFQNRLDDDHALQSCSTLAYILGINKPRYSSIDTQVNSPYNTYLFKGLPPGPISCPGAAAVQAALSPAETDYYFFMATPAGETLFSETIEEHNKNIYLHLR